MIYNELTIALIPGDQTPASFEVPEEETVQFEVSQGDVYIINSARLEKDFTASDFSARKLFIGKNTAGMRIQKVSCHITGAFDEGTITIGDESAHGRLVPAEQFNLLTEDSYHAEPDYEYEEATDLYMYFETGEPVTGNGTIIIYQQ